MRKLTSFFLLIILATASQAQTSLSEPVTITRTATGNYSGFLKANGKLITDGSGNPFILRGMGLGGWMLQEGYMFRIGNIGAQSRIRAKIEELVGPDQANTFYNEWLSSHTTKGDIDSMAAWGFNSIRLPMHYGLYTLPVEAEPVAGQNTWLQKGFDLTDSLLAWCRAHHMYLILDLHATPGGQGNDLPISDRDPARPSLWQSEANQKKMIALWHKLAERYANDPSIGGYDIINEPNWGFEDSTDIRGTKEKTNAPLRKLMMEITAAIRQVDKNHIIIIEGNGFGNNYNGILPVWDDNMVLSFHKYGNFNTTGDIQRYLDLREQYNVPLWLGESGENSNTWFTEAIGLAESQHIGWCWWQEKKMGINNPLEIKITPSYQSLLNYWQRNGPKPSAAEATQAMHDWLESVRLKNTVYHKDVTDAMFRQVHTVETMPFQYQVITNGTVVKAVDYDLGRVGYAYKDNDTARYQYVTPPIATAGNRGGAYRNDGVDIQTEHPSAAQTEYYVFNIEDGEWLQYTVNVKETGKYRLLFTIAAANTGSQLSILNNGKPVLQNLAIPNTGSMNTWTILEAKDVQLQKGMNKLRILADKGGFNFKSIQFNK